MKPRNDILVLMLTSNPVSVVRRALEAAGYEVPRAKLEEIRSSLIESGVARPMIDPALTGERIADPSIGARFGCDALHRRTMQMFARTAQRHRVSVEAAQLAALYSRAQLARMVA